MPFCLIDGNEAIARAAVMAGCRFFAGYPITPATPIFNEMLKLLPPVGGICMQGEDEIASIGFCLGASLAGVKAMTATSGPGISLYSEQISFAIACEIPIVIVDVQRLGPSTGSATRGADGDIQFLRWGNSGGLPVIVLAPVDVQDCFVLTVRAFNLSERFRCPVFIASNKEIGMTRETVNLKKVKYPPIENRKLADENISYLPFKAPDEKSPPPFLPIGSKIPVRITSSTHGVDGYITTDPEEIGRFQKRLYKKIESRIHEYTFFELNQVPGADTLIITYGVTARSARVTAKRLNSKNRPVSLLILKTLWPVPEELITETARNYSKIVVVEMNLGQYIREIKRLLPDKNVKFLGQMNGMLITPDQIEEAVTS